MAPDSDCSFRDLYHSDTDDVKTLTSTRLSGVPSIDGTRHELGSADSHLDDDDHRERLPRKRRSGDTHLPFKRQKGVLKIEYLDLLNLDIDDVAHRVCLNDWVELPHTQIGVTSWSPIEKRQFFEALARLGRHDLPGIASRVSTKSLLEIRHYIDFLQEAHSLKRRYDRRSFLETAEYPAAVELSQPCCHAQEEAADAIALRQEQREIQREERKWGAYWDITPSIALRLDQDQDAEANQPLRCAQLFPLSRWLKLSERFFMNSSVPGNNWNYVDDVPPSMWATTFDDFYSLAVSVTRRLVQTTLFISMSRIRAKRQLIPNTKDVVRRRDVEAAIASLGMVRNAHEYWAKIARRLRLHVYEQPPGRTEEGDEEPMTYDEVESALCEEQDVEESEQGPMETIKLEATCVDEDEADDEDTANDGEEDETLREMQERDEINREANEVLWYSAADLRDVTSTRQALKLRIAMERRQEEQADRCDEYASYQAETEMWSILQKQPPIEIPKKQDPGRPERSNLDVESVYPIARDWTSRLKYCGEWETRDQGPERKA